MDRDQGTQSSSLNFISFLIYDLMVSHLFYWWGRGEREGMRRRARGREREGRRDGHEIESDGNVFPANFNILLLPISLSPLLFPAPILFLLTVLLSLFLTSYQDNMISVALSAFDQSNKTICR